MERIKSPSEKMSATLSMIAKNIPAPLLWGEERPGMKVPLPRVDMPVAEGCQRLFLVCRVDGLFFDRTNRLRFGSRKGVIYTRPCRRRISDKPSRRP